MSRITVLNEKAIAVYIPEYQYHLLGSRLFYKEPMDRKWKYLVLPSGLWSILGRPEEITEEQWKGIAEWFSDYEVYSNSGYRNYSHPQAEATMKNATQSGLSLLKSKGLNPIEVIILIKQ